MFKKFASLVELTKTRTITLTILTIIPPIITILAVIRYGLNFPFYDEWQLVPQIVNFNQGILKFQDLIAWHNEHRPFFPRLIMILTARLTHWNISYELAINVFLGITLFTILFFQLKKTSQQAKLPKLLYLTPILSFFVFSLTQYENWSWGWQIQIWLSITTSVAGLFVLSNYPKSLRWFFLAIILGVVSLYSFAAGIAYLTTGLIILLITRKNNNNFKMILIWSITSTTLILTYFLNFNTAMNSVHFAISNKEALKLVAYILAYLGSPLSLSTSGLSIFFGIICILITICLPPILLKRFKLSIISPFISLNIFVLTNALITGAGRVGFETAQALSSRYTSFTLLSWVSNLILICLLFFNTEKSKDLKSKLLFQGSILSLTTIIFFTIASSMYGLVVIKDRYVTLKNLEEKLINSDNSQATSSMFLHIYPYYKDGLLIERIELLKQYKLSIFK